jgi:cysteinyl-tRNA synthetase
VRLFDTATKTLMPVGPPGGHIGMYFCGPTVYARAHAGNARPFVLGMWLTRWLRASGRTVTFVDNITDISDKIYLAAPDASADLASAATEWYLEDVSALGLGMPDHIPPRDGARPPHHRVHRTPHRQRLRLRRGPRRLLPGLQ